MFSARLKTLKYMGDHTEVIYLTIQVKEGETIDEVMCNISNAKKQIGLPMTILPTDIIEMQMII